MKILDIHLIMALHGVNRADWQFLDSKTEKIRITNTERNVEVKFKICPKIINGLFIPKAILSVNNQLLHPIHTSLLLESKLVSVLTHLNWTNYTLFMLVGHC